MKTPGKSTDTHVSSGTLRLPWTHAVRATRCLGYTVECEGDARYRLTSSTVYTVSTEDERVLQEEICGGAAEGVSSLRL